MDIRNWVMFRMYRGIFAASLWKTGCSQRLQKRYDFVWNVLIGGAACDILFESNEVNFRATRDLDMVLIIEALTPEFYCSWKISKQSNEW